MIVSASKTETLCSMKLIQALQFFCRQMLFDHLIQIDEKFFVVLKLLRVKLVLLHLGLFLL